MSDPAQFGTWQRIGNEPYVLEKSIRATRYRWTAPKRWGDFTIDFQSVEQSPHRRFYPVRVLEALRDEREMDEFIDDVCKFGLTALIESDTSSGVPVAPMPEMESLEFQHALFATRRHGHARVTRRMTRLEDLLDEGAATKTAELIVPGYTWGSIRHIGERIKGNQVLERIQESLYTKSQKRDHSLEYDDYPLRTLFDDVVLVGRAEAKEAGRIHEIGQIRNTVAPALIHGIDLVADSCITDDEAETRRHLIRRLVSRYFKKPQDFQRWFRNESEKGFVRLLPQFQQYATPNARQLASDQARRYYRRILWSAYHYSAGFVIVYPDTLCGECRLSYLT